jgi:hypothetical protein
MSTKLRTSPRLSHPVVLKTPQPILQNGLEKSQETVQHKACSTKALEKENFVQESSYHLNKVLVATKIEFVIPNKFNGPIGDKIFTTIMAATDYEEKRFQVQVSKLMFQFQTLVSVIFHQFGSTQGQFFAHENDLFMEN